MREREREREREEIREERGINLLEFPDPLHHVPVLVVAEMVIVSPSVPRIEGVVAYDIQSLLRQATLFITSQHSVEVLVMAEGHCHLVQATVGLIHATLGAGGKEEEC